ncbi:hypothetical protein GUJ93_ZPchr0002g23816 [Zizania palustris]|uniref:Glabrous enhancer-binding protein-like DBD domain-containing protein n=1 Tax=Zizania palustris TaxID=103762 RepID=A0A8J5VVY4_ZIZPA|nr:hypothetical protein GUJ93_ZPchr0002g23816 [Zizania palustris]
MARKHRAPSPPPQPESSDESSTGEEEEEVEDSPAAPAPQKPSDRGAASSDGDEENSDTDTYAQAFQLRKLVRSPGNEEGEEGGSSESEPENPEPARKETAKKPKAEEKKKRSAPEPAKTKKAVAAVERAAPEPAPSGKAKKAAKAEAGKAGNSEAGKAAPEHAPSGKAKKSRVKPEKVEVEKAAPDPSPSNNKSGKSGTRWTTDDEIKILQFLTKHVKSHGTHPKPDEIIAALGGSLDRKNNSRSDMYEKVRRLRLRYETTAKKVAENGTLPAKDEDLRMYKLSLEIWGKDEKEAVSVSTAQNNGTPSKSKKEQAKKDKVDGCSNEGTTVANENAGTLEEKKRRKATKQKATVETKIKLSKDAAPATPAKSKKRGIHKDKLDEEAKSVTSKETTTTAPHGDGTLVESKRGKADKENLNRDTDSAMPKETTTATENGGILSKSKGRETYKEEIETNATVTGIQREFVELQKVYPNLAYFVNIIEVQHPCGGSFKRAFESISDDKACTLESKIKKQRVAEMKMQLRRADTKKEVTNILLGLLD